MEECEGRTAEGVTGGEKGEEEVGREERRGRKEGRSKCLRTRDAKERREEGIERDSV